MTPSVARFCKQLFILLLFIASPANAAPDYWRVWLTALNHQCPANHVDWVFDGGYDDLLAAFDKTLPTTTRRKVSEIADASAKRSCATETMGFSCEMSEYLSAYGRLGLMPKFVSFGCSHVKCEEIANCTSKGF